MVSSAGNASDPELLVLARECFERHIQTSTNFAVEDVLSELNILPECESGRAIILDLMPVEILHRQDQGRSLDLAQELQRFPFLTARRLSSESARSFSSGTPRSPMTFTFPPPCLCDALASFRKMRM